MNGWYMETYKDGARLTAKDGHTFQEVWDALVARDDGVILRFIAPRDAPPEQIDKLVAFGAKRT